MWVEPNCAFKMHADSADCGAGFVSSTEANPK
jgi:hypothetical protein